MADVFRRPNIVQDLHNFINLKALDSASDYKTPYKGQGMLELTILCIETGLTVESYNHGWSEPVLRGVVADVVKKHNDIAKLNDMNDWVGEKTSQALYEILWYASVLLAPKHSYLGRQNDRSTTSEVQWVKGLNRVIEKLKEAV
jgi:hypothetical protein